MEVTQRKTDT